MKTRAGAAINSGEPGRAQGGFTLIEVLVVVAIIALLVSILLPSLAKAREIARRAVCASRLHNMGVSVHEYSHTNKGAIIVCKGGAYKAGPVGDNYGPVIQVAISPRLGGSEPEGYTDWQGQARRHHLDKELWECPNRPKSFYYEGIPDPAVQGFTAAELRTKGYNVEDRLSVLGGDYDQWMIGYQYFGGIKQWENDYGPGVFKSRSPLDSNAKPFWALAADSNVEVDGGWGRGRPSAYANIAPHPKPDGSPEGGNVLTFDGAVNWIRFGRMVPLHSWASSRRGYWYQSDLGDFGKYYP